MRFLHACLLFLLAAGGCATKSGARLEAQRAVWENQQMAAMELQQREPAVWFKGDIRQPRVVWQEGLTLAQALTTAQYTWDWDPRSITITREGKAYKVNVRRLLRGQDNPELEPGDVIEVRH